MFDSSVIDVSSEVLAMNTCSQNISDKNYFILTFFMVKPFFSVKRKVGFSNLKRRMGKK